MPGGGTQVRSRELTRRQLIRGTLGAAGVVALGVGAFGASRLLGHRHRLPAYRSSASKGPVREFVSRPDLRPPVVRINDTGVRGPLIGLTRGDVAPGYLFLGPSAAGPAMAGPMIVDDEGEPVWYRPIPRSLWATDVR